MAYKVTYSKPFHYETKVDLGWCTMSGERKDMDLSYTVCGFSTYAEAEEYTRTLPRDVSDVEIVQYESQTFVVE